jgi:acetyl esterase
MRGLLGLLDGAHLALFKPECQRKRSGGGAVERSPVRSRADLFGAGAIAYAARRQNTFPPEDRPMAMTLEAPPVYAIQVQDIEYRRDGDTPLMATLYRPEGSGPFAAVLEVHGGAWTTKDRFNNAATAKYLAQCGIVVLSIDFRMPPEAPYPASLQDINYAIRWLKLHAREWGSSPERVGIYGTSSGGNQALLAAMRPNDPRYRALTLAAAPELDAKVAFVVIGWGVLDPVQRYGLARRSGTARLVAAHDAFWGSEAAMSDGSPPLILRRGEPVQLPPAFLYQGTTDKWTPVETAQDFVALYREAGGEAELALFEGEPHAFVNDHPDSPNTAKAMATMATFIHKWDKAP